MAEPGAINPWEGYSFAQMLRNIGKRAGSIASGVPNEIAANLVDLGDNAKAAALTLVPGVGALNAARDVIKRFSPEPAPLPEEAPTLRPTPFATHSNDRATQAVGMLLDPTNLAGAGVLGKLVRSAKGVVPKAIERMGASKEAREASAARRAADAAELEAPVREKPRSAEERAAVAPDKYRQMYNAEGEQAVIDAATRGEHIRKAPSGGGYTGFPRDITTRRQIRERLRPSLDRQLDDAQSALTYAEEPARVGNWYQRARAGITESTEPYMMDRVLENQATHSAGVSPENEIVFALRHGQSRALGDAQRGFRGAQQEALDDAVAGNPYFDLGAKYYKSDPVPADMRFKISEYRNKNDPRRDQGSPFGTNDFRYAQGFNYTHPGGEKWHAGVSDQMHPVMDAESALVVDRARKRGQPNITGEMVQEFPWVLGKAEDLFLQGKFAGDTELESKVNALREANKSTADYQQKHAMSLTYGHRPGEGIGHRSDIGELPLEQQAEYGPKWTRPPTGADPHARDAIASALRLRQLPPMEGVGSWLGKPEAVGIARPLVYPEVGSVMKVTPEQTEALKAGEMFRGLVSGQRAVAGNLPVTMQSRAGKNALLLERMGMNEVGNPASHLPTVDEMTALEPLAGKYGYGVTPTSRGALMFPDPEKLKGMSVAQKLRGLRKAKGFEEAAAALPGSTPKQAAQEGFYENVVPKERYMGKGVGTARVLRQMAKAPPEVSRGLSESDEIRRIIKKQIEVDADAGAEGKQVSAPLQKTRQWLSDADVNKVVELVRGGMKVPAAMAAAGYSLSGMAAEPEVAR